MSQRPIAILKNRYSPVNEVSYVQFADFAEKFAKATTGEKDGSAWMPVDIDPGPRKAEHVRTVSYLVLDVEAKAELIRGDHGEPIHDMNGATVKRVIGAEPPEIDALLADLRMLGWQGFVHTTYSHTPEHPRYRVLLNPDRPLEPHEVQPLGLHVAAVLGVSHAVDVGCLEPARLYYFPRVPKERAFAYRHASVDGGPLPADALLEGAERAQAALGAAPQRTGGGDSVIRAYNEAHDIGALLVRHGYEARGRGRWLCPKSTTGMPGVRVLPKSEPERVFSSHGGDPLNDGRAHDAFDVFRILEHGGDIKAAVRAAAALLGLATSPEREMPAARALAWPDPLLLTARIKPEAYPLDALPDIIRAAVEEVQGFAQAPLALVAGCALSAVSVACQAYVDVQRTEGLEGPSGLFFLAIADSGERKTTVDNYFTRAIREYDAQQAEAMARDVKRHVDELDIWNGKREGLLAAIKEKSKKQQPTDDLSAKLDALRENEPSPPRVPRLIVGDETPENLAWRLAKQWPSAGMIVAEAGIVFGGHAMGSESVMRTLSLLNTLWDGKEHHVGRRTSESFSVRGARLTIGLQVQEVTLRDYFAKTGPLARGTGFLARCLLAWPESTQGNRPFKTAPHGWPALERFDQRMAQVLGCKAPIGEDGALRPQMLTLAPDAFEAWEAFYNATEAELAPGRELDTISDVASKAADNCARLAALLHCFEGRQGPVGLESVESASRIVAWHLRESRRFFGEIALPAEQGNAVRLDAWLLDHCRRESGRSVAKRDAQRLGPIRDGKNMEAALEVLEEMHRARVMTEGKRKNIEVNPALVRMT